jgi:hypothetical protein
LSSKAVGTLNNQLTKPLPQRVPGVLPTVAFFPFQEATVNLKSGLTVATPVILSAANDLCISLVDRSNQFPSYTTGILRGVQPERNEKDPSLRSG